MPTPSGQYMNKRHIRSRMRRFATTYFAINRSELLDPVVSLFLESMAEEVYKIAGEIDNLENRIVNRLSNMLVPDTDTIAKPAHAILHASPTESRLELTTSTEFYYSGYDKNKNRLSFYPVCNTRLYKGDIRYFVCNGLLYATGSDQLRTPVTGNGRKELLAAHSFWIALELDPAVENLSGLSFYIDFQGVYNKNECLNWLPYSGWKIKGQALSMAKGLFSKDETFDNEVVELFSTCDFSCKINKEVKSIYDTHFLTVTDDFPLHDQRETFPEGLKGCFPENVRASFDQPLLWIEVCCPSGFTPDIIHSMQISINAFPVVNKQLVCKTEDISRVVPVIPLPTERNESFLSVHSLIDSNGTPYYDIPVKESGKQQGIYSMRRGGCERYNARDANEYLVDLVHSLAGEVSSFFKNRKNVENEMKFIAEKVNGLVRQLNKVISEVKDRQETEHYLLIDPEETGRETFFVQYWVTNSMEANHIGKGTNLYAASSDLPVHPASIHTLSPTQGGKKAPLAKDKNNLYKKSLSQHCLLITHEDIKNFCEEHFQDFFTEISIRKGWIESPDPAIGFIPAIDVYMKSGRETESYFGKQSGNFLERILTEKSPATYRYRVFIDN